MTIRVIMWCEKNKPLPASGPGPGDDAVGHYWAICLPVVYRDLGLSLRLGVGWVNCQCHGVSVLHDSEHAIPSQLFACHGEIRVILVRA
jgi:hypothetical protein